MGNPFKARVAVAHLNSLLLCYLTDKLGRHNGLDNKVSRLHLSGGLAVRNNVPQENHTCLIAVDEHPLALIVLASHAHSVGIRVARHQDIGIQFLRIAQA